MRIGTEEPGVEWLAWPTIVGFRAHTTPRFVGLPPASGNGPDVLAEVEFHGQVNPLLQAMANLIPTASAQSWPDRSA